MKLPTLLRTGIAVLTFHAQVAVVQAQAPAEASPSPTTAPTTAPSLAPASPQLPSPSVQPAIGSDVVRLRDGSQFRGTLVEQVPDSHVILVTFSGEAKRFAAADVEYAGPLANVPAAPAPVAATPPTPGSLALEPSPAGTIRLTLRPPAGLSFYRAQVDAPPSLLCHGECVADVAPGPYRFAIGSDTRPPVAVAETLEISADDEISGEFASRRGSRIGGGALLAGGLAAGLSLLGAGIHQNNEYAHLKDICENAVQGMADCGSSNNGPAIAKIVTGVISAAVGTIVGVLLIRQKDAAYAHARKATPALPSADSPLGATAAAEEPALAAAPPSPDVTLLEGLTPRVLACSSGPKNSIKVRLSVGEDGKVGALLVQGDASRTVKSCVEEILNGVVFPAGERRFVTHTF